MSRIAQTIALVLMVIAITIPAQNVPAAPVPAGSSQELEALRADARKMRVILEQMRTNLAFVQTTQTPLKHQFELEIDMWQVVLDQMDRRIDKKDSQPEQAK